MSSQPFEMAISSSDALSDALRFVKVPDDDDDEVWWPCLTFSNHAEMQTVCGTANFLSGSDKLKLSIEFMNAVQTKGIAIAGNMKVVCMLGGYAKFRDGKMARYVDEDDDLPELCDFHTNLYKMVTWYSNHRKWNENLDQVNNMLQSFQENTGEESSSAAVPAPASTAAAVSPASTASMDSSATTNNTTCKLRPGDAVYANWKEAGKYYAAVVLKVSNEGARVTVRYDDNGSTESLKVDNVYKSTDDADTEMTQSSRTGRSANESKNPSRRSNKARQRSNEKLAKKKSADKRKKKPSKRKAKDMEDGEQLSSAKLVQKTSKANAGSSPSASGAEKETYVLPDFSRDIWPILRRELGFNYQQPYYCFPGVNPELDNTKLGQDYFEKPNELRRHLCAYGLPKSCSNRKTQLNEEATAALEKWIRYSIVHSLKGKNTNRVPEEGRDPITFRKAWNTLQKIGFRYRGGKYVFPGIVLKRGHKAPSSQEKLMGVSLFSTQKEFCLHLARFGLPAKSVVLKVNYIERLKLELFIAECPDLDIFTQFDRLETDPPLDSLSADLPPLRPERAVATESAQHTAEAVNEDAAMAAVSPDSNKSESPRAHPNNQDGHVNFSPRSSIAGGGNCSVTGCSADGTQVARNKCDEQSESFRMAPTSETLLQEEHEELITPPSMCQ